MLNVITRRGSADGFMRAACGFLIRILRFELVRICRWLSGCAVSSLVMTLIASVVAMLSGGVVQYNRTNRNNVGRSRRWKGTDERACRLVAAKEVLANMECSLFVGSTLGAGRVGTWPSPASPVSGVGGGGASQHFPKRCFGARQPKLESVTCSSPSRSVNLLQFLKLLL